MTNLNIILPTCWQELTPKQLRYAYYLLAQNSMGTANRCAENR